MTEQDSPIVPHTRIQKDSSSDEDVETVETYETKEDGSTFGVPVTTRAQTE